MSTPGPGRRWSIRGESWAQVYRVGHGYGDLDVNTEALGDLDAEQWRRLGQALITVADLDLADTDQAGYGYVNVNVNDQGVASVLPERARAVGLALIEAAEHHVSPVIPPEQWAELMKLKP